MTGRATENLRFYTQVLGMRLVKKTVNQDDISAYHLYADETGSPGSKLTFFDWPDASQHRPGAGEVATIALRVPGRTALQYWADRLSGARIEH